MPIRQASASGSSTATPPPKKKRGGFFGCRSKHALDSLPRNARGDNAAIHRLQARNVFQQTPNLTDSSSTTAAVTPLTEEKGLQKLAELNSTTTSLAPSAPNKPLYAQEVPDNATTELGQAPQIEEETEKDEARDMFIDEALVPVYDRPTTPGPMRNLSMTSKTERIKRSLSLKRSGSTASTNLIARAPPVSSADFADLPSETVEPADLQGDMASIRMARGRHQVGIQQFADISEDEYLALDNPPIPPHRPLPNLEDHPETPAKKHSLQLAMPESDSMRAVAAALEGSSDSGRFRPGPSVGTPKLEPASPASDAYAAEIQSLHRKETSEDTVSDLPGETVTRGFWEPVAEEAMGPGRTIPFQYVTNLARPVSIASLRSLACPSTPPRTSSRPTSPDGTYHGLRSTKSFSVSPLKKQATFNGFPRTFFPRGSTLKHSPSVASDRSHRKPVPDAIPALEFEQIHAERQRRRLARSHRPQEEEEENDVERELGHGRTHTCSNCGLVEDQFAAFVAKERLRDARRSSNKRGLLQRDRCEKPNQHRNRIPSVKLR